VFHLKIDFKLVLNNTVILNNYLLAVLLFFGGFTPKTDFFSENIYCHKVKKVSKYA
jgi:hypothetical protein